MFFLLRSAFWLSIVFSAMPWNGEGSPTGNPRLLDAARGATAAAAKAAGEYCSATPAECLFAAQKLHALFERIAAEGEAELANLKQIPPAPALSAQDKTPAWRGYPAPK